MPDLSRVPLSAAAKDEVDPFLVKLPTKEAVLELHKIWKAEFAVFEKKASGDEKLQIEQTLQSQLDQTYHLLQSSKTKQLAITNKLVSLSTSEEVELANYLNETLRETRDLEGVMRGVVVEEDRDLNGIVRLDGKGNVEVEVEGTVVPG